MKTMSKGGAAIAAIAALAVLPFSAVPAGAAVPHFRNCTAMHKVYPHGAGLKGEHDHVTSGTPVTNFARRPRVYRANRVLDRDHDHIACEAH